MGTQWHVKGHRVPVSQPGWTVTAGEANVDTAPVGIAATRARGVRLLRLDF